MNQKLLLFGVIVLVIVGAGSYVLGTKNFQPAQTDYLSISPTAVQSNEIPDETANWKTLNGKYYSIKYPQSLEYSNSGGVLPSDQLEDPNKQMISIQAYPDDIGFKVERSELVTKNIEEIMIADQKVTRVVYENSRDKGTIIDVGPVRHKRLNYLITYFSLEPYIATQKDISLFDQILSTFKFTN